MIDDYIIDNIWKDLVFSIIGHNFPLVEHVNGFRFLDRLKKHKHVKLELWLDIGLAKHAKGSQIWEKNYKKKESICEGLHQLISRSHPVSIHQIIFKDHYTANKT